MKKWYYIPSENKLVSFTIQLKHHTKDGKVCYLGNSTITGKEVWLYNDAIEYTVRGKYKNQHKIASAYEVREPAGLDPNSYVWRGEVRDKRVHSMCARPYFPR